MRSLDRSQPGRRYTIYDAVAGRISSHGYSRPWIDWSMSDPAFIANFTSIQQRQTDSRRGMSLTGALPIPPDEVLFREAAAPDRWEEDDVYFAPIRGLENDNVRVENLHERSKVKPETAHSEPSEGDASESESGSAQSTEAERDGSDDPNDDNGNSTDGNSGTDDVEMASTGPTSATKPPGHPSRNLPNSDLLKAIHTFASDLYGRNPDRRTDQNSERWQSMDGTALLAIGILAEELARERVNGPGRG